MNRTQISSTPLKHHNLSDVSLLNIDITELNSNLEAGLTSNSETTFKTELVDDSSSDTIILEGSYSTLPICFSPENTSFKQVQSHNTSSNGLFLDMKICENTVKNVTYKSTDINMSDNSLGNKLCINLTNQESSDISLTSKSINMFKRSPQKKIPINFENNSKTINTSYLTTLEQLFSNIENTVHLKSILSHYEYSILKLFSSSENCQNYQYVCLKLLTWKEKWYNISTFCERINIVMEEDEIVELYKTLEKNRIVDTGLYIFINSFLFHLVHYTQSLIILY